MHGGHSGGLFLHEPRAQRVGDAIRIFVAAYRTEHGVAVVDQFASGVESDTSRSAGYDDKTLSHGFPLSISRLPQKAAGQHEMDGTGERHQAEQQQRLSQ